MGKKEYDEGYRKGSFDAENERGNRNTTDFLSPVLGETDKERGYEDGYKEHKK